MPKIGGFTVLSTKAYTIPATPASALVSVNAITLVRATSTPIAAAASGLSRTARQARPNHESSSLFKMEYVKTSRSTMTAVYHGPRTRMPKSSGSR